MTESVGSIISRIIWLYNVSCFIHQFEFAFDLQYECDVITISSGVWFLESSLCFLLTLTFLAAL